VSGMGIRMGAFPGDVQVGGKSAHAPILVSVPPGISLGGNVLEQPSAAKPVADDCDAARGGYLAVALPGVSHLVQSPAYSGAGGPGWNSEASRGEPEALESALGTAGGAR